VDPEPGFEIPPTKGDAQLELAVGFTQLLADSGGGMRW